MHCVATFPLIYDCCCWEYFPQHCVCFEQQQQYYSDRLTRAYKVIVSCQIVSHSEQCFMEEHWESLIQGRAASNMHCCVGG